MRYARQIQLPGFGSQLQEKLAHAKILIIGCGGLGTSVAQSLAAMGFGNIQLIDGDTIKEENLHRQFLFNPEDIGKMKASVLSQKLSRQNPEIRIETEEHYFQFPKDNYLIEKSDIIIDTSDNLTCRRSVSEACIQLAKPLFYGAAIQWRGMAMVQLPDSKNPIVDYLDQEIEGQCSEEGIFPPVLSWVSSILCTEVFRYIQTGNTAIQNRLELFDANSNTYHSFLLNKSV